IVARPVSDPRPYLCHMVLQHPEKEKWGQDAQRLCQAAEGPK
ncbi:hypothetical protein E2320_007167, partial [Naja naja]